MPTVSREKTRSEEERSDELSLLLLLSALPLALQQGTGSELRRPLGIAVVGGLVLSQVLTLYTTPVAYLAVEHVRLWLRKLRGKVEGPAMVPEPQQG